MFCACEDNTIREFGQKAVGQTAVTEFSPLAIMKTSESVGSLVLDERVLFTGSLSTERPGFIYAHKLTGDDWATREPLKFPGHSSNVTCIKLSYDRSQLFSGGSDGSIFGALGTGACAMREPFRRDLARPSVISSPRKRRDLGTDSDSIIAIAIARRERAPPPKMAVDGCEFWLTMDSATRG